MKNVLNRFFLSTLVFIALNAQAGWVITQRHSNNDGLIKYETVTIEGNMVKSAGLDGTLIFDLKNQTLLLGNESKKVYWKGSIDDFRETFQNSIKTIIEELIKELPEDQRDIYREWFSETINMYAKTTITQIDSLDVEIIKSSDYEDIAGCKSIKSEVIVNGSLREKLWISSTIPLAKEFDMKRLTQFMNEVEPNANNENLYQNSEAYLDLMREGYPMRIIDVSGIQIEVIKVEKLKTQKSDFEFSEDFKEVGLDKIIRLAMIGEGSFENEEDGED